MGTLRGITRGTILEIARKSRISTHEHVLTRHEMFISDECFLTGTAVEVVPVVKVDGRRIGTGKPGKMTLKFMQDLKKLTKTEGVKYSL